LRRNPSTHAREDFNARVRRHAVVLNKLKGHPNVVQFTIPPFEDSATGGYWLLEEWIGGSYLTEFVKRREVETCGPPLAHIGIWRSTHSGVA